MLGLDEALEQFRREFQIRILGPQTKGTEREQPATKPSADSSGPAAPTSFRSTPDPLPNGSGNEPDDSTQPAERGEAVDAGIDSIWSEDASPVVPVRFSPLPERLSAWFLPVDGREYSERGPSRYYAVEDAFRGFPAPHEARARRAG